MTHRSEKTFQVIRLLHMLLQRPPNCRDRLPEEEGATPLEEAVLHLVGEPLEPPVIYHPRGKVLAAATQEALDRTQVRQLSWRELEAWANPLTASKVLVLAQEKEEAVATQVVGAGGAGEVVGPAMVVRLILFGLTQSRCRGQAQVVQLCRTRLAHLAEQVGPSQVAVALVSCSLYLPMSRQYLFRQSGLVEPDEFQLDGVGSEAMVPAWVAVGVPALAAASEGAGEEPAWAVAGSALRSKWVLGLAEEGGPAAAELEVAK